MLGAFLCLQPGPCFGVLAVATNSQTHEYLLPPEAADLLRCSDRTLARMRAEGKGPRYYMRGSRILYVRALVDEWLAENIVSPVRSGS